MSTRTITRILTATLTMAIVAATLVKGQTPAPDTAVQAVAASAPVAAAAPDHTSALLEVHGADSELTTMVESAAAQFTSVGLILPPLRVYAHPNRDGCTGADGLYRSDQSGHRIDLCTRLKHTILHELAHAWENYQVSDDTRQAFMDGAELEVWNDQSVDWAERGIEAAAQTVAWGLMDLPISRPERFAEQAYLFELLTGIPSPRLPDPGGVATGTEA